MYLCQHKKFRLYNRYMTSNQCGVLFSDIDLQSFVNHYVHGHPKLAVNDDGEYAFECYTVIPEGIIKTDSHD